ncbi:hypothetical protein M378DRAFT_19150 [Amanita muscaria Koide BX008]|uniref:Uncharacterized protein n=1 Tax=Amanita muscaria (strain Koide BX008) TaxID=946122 RepID=A0A0C2WC70_AMAMK|nr:hypothetical protein M378DRAFT_19150 [Amanita muscaria Koide BX008]
MWASAVSDIYPELREQIPPQFQVQDDDSDVSEIHQVEIDNGVRGGSSSGGGATAQSTPYPGVFPAPPLVFDHYGGGNGGEPVELDLVFVEEITRRSTPAKLRKSTLSHYMWFEEENKFWKSTNKFWKGLEKSFPKTTFTKVKNCNKDWGTFFSEWNALVLSAETLNNAFFKWKITKMTWETFKEAMLRAEGNAWESCKKANCIVGGADFTVDFMRREDCYGFTPEELDRYLDRLTELEKERIVWPSPVEMLHVGSKIPLLKDLKDIALKMGMPFPSIQIIDEFPKMFSDNLFLKRGYSDCTMHALHVSVQRPKERREFKQLWEETESLYGKLPESVRPKWFSMPYMKSLKHLGEMRCYMVGGIFSHIIQTIPGSENETVTLHMATMDEVTPLEAVGQADNALETTSLGSMSTTIWQSGRAELERFVCGVHDSLVEKEEARCKRPSGLRMLARYDVSVFKYDNGFHFLVNEVERTHSMGLFMTTNDQLAYRLLTSLSHILAGAVLLKAKGEERRIYKGHETFTNEKERRLMGRN